MKQSDPTPYVHSPYHTTMHLFGSVFNSSTVPETRQYPFDDNSYFSTVPHHTLSRVAESSLDLWLMDVPETASPESSRLSMSPSQGIATPPSDGLYSPTFPEQLQLPSFEIIEQPQPVRSSSTSHPNWANNGENWERTYAENDLWCPQPFVSQPWVPNTYDEYTHTSNNLIAFSAQIQLPSPEPIEIRAVTRSPVSEANQKDEVSSDEDSDWDEEASDYSQSASSASEVNTSTRVPGARVGRWLIPTNTIQQSESRGYACPVLGCEAAFLRPEHLRRHVRSKHTVAKDYACVIPDCGRGFSRSDNLRDHYWTHLQRGGRSGKNKKFTIKELKAMLGPKERKLLKRLRKKLGHHLEKERLKKQQRAKPAMYVVRSML